jgi:hypothetical protein
LAKEFLVCGVEGWNGNWNEGLPVFSPPLAPAVQTIADTIVSRHIENPSTYCVTDLRTHAVNVFNLVTPVQWDAYRAIQKAEIDYQRKVLIMEPCCRDKNTCCDLMVQALVSGEPEKRAAWLAAIASINASLPYPSGQE